jgi:hypothetical protein
VLATFIDALGRMVQSGYAFKVLFDNNLPDVNQKIGGINMDVSVCVDNPFP